MADDTVEIMGKWTVWVKQWVWEYEFSPGGKVTWRDTRSREQGVGRWSSSPKFINMSWFDSATTESFNRPLTPAKQEGWYNAPSYYVGKYKAEKVVAGASRGATDVNPSIANQPWEKYVDVYTDSKYDINYKIPPNQSFAFSSILQLTYNDGATLELDIEKDFSSAPISSEEARNAMAQGAVGRAGRIFPRVLNAGTTPRLWRARFEALGDQDKEAQAFMGMAVTVTAVVLSVPAMPAGMGDAAVASQGVSRRTVPGTRVPPAPIQGNMVRLGPGNGPGSLWASIQSTALGVIYRVDMIFLQGKGAAVATARATHREMIRRAAQTAQAAGQKQFKMVGKQANPNFVRHADQLAKEIGVAGSGKQGSQGAGFADYEVILDVAKTLAQ
jgi:hypothetical protein